MMAPAWPVRIGGGGDVGMSAMSTTTLPSPVPMPRPVPGRDDDAVPPRADAVLELRDGSDGSRNTLSRGFDDASDACIALGEPATRSIAEHTA
jgi:hypothetical protein